MLRILLIDDDEAVRKATTILLEAHGFEVATTPDGQSGSDAIRAGAFDLAIIDLFMPGIDGLQTIKAVRQHNARIAIIATSGSGFGGLRPSSPNFEAQAMEAGANATLYKPFRSRDLRQAIDTALAAGAGKRPHSP
jgi:CheY-like chemotaxis protein